MRVLLIDNYDSFTYNLVHVVEPMVKELVVWRNDEFKIEDVASFDKIIFSPGPSLPSQAGLMMQVIEDFHKEIPMFGVCLGMQALVEFFGGELSNLEPVRHGTSKKISVEQRAIFKGLEGIQEVGLYHSWGINKIELPDSFECLSLDDDKVVMACIHNSYDLAGVQFHPESVMTPHGNEMLRNWILTN